jgi:hypothetical protein
MTEKLTLRYENKNEVVEVSYEGFICYKDPTFTTWFVHAISSIGFDGPKFISEVNDTTDVVGLQYRGRE